MKKQTQYWKMNNGQTIRLCDMTDQHLLNTIKWIERKVEQIKQEMPMPMFQGDMAQYYAEQEYDAAQAAEPDYFFPIYRNMFMEKIRRNI